MIIKLVRKFDSQIEWVDCESARTEKVVGQFLTLTVQTGRPNSKGNVYMIGEWTAGSATEEDQGPDLWYRVYIMQDGKTIDTISAPNYDRAAQTVG
jgi:hypothetical protein